MVHMAFVQTFEEIFVCLIKKYHLESDQKEIAITSHQHSFQLFIIAGLFFRNRLYTLPRQTASLMSLHQHLMMHHLLQLYFFDKFQRFQKVSRNLWLTQPLSHLPKTQIPKQWSQIFRAPADGQQPKQDLNLHNLQSVLNQVKASVSKYY